MSRLRQIFSCHAGAPGSADPGAGRMRALDGDEKLARRHDILDAAESLFAQNLALANVADIADAAGLAKGTVYLYFQSKEEIYLALHLRKVESFMTALIERLGAQRPFAFSEMTALAAEHMLDAPTYLPLGACCAGFAASAVPAAAAARSQASLSEWLRLAGAGLERHFPRLAAGEGTRLLHHSYAIMIGLYSLMRSEFGVDLNCANTSGLGSFRQEASLALTRYWSQVAGIDAPPAVQAEKPLGKKTK